MPAGSSLLLARIKWHCTEQVVFLCLCYFCFRVTLVWPRDKSYVVLTTLLSSSQNTFLFSSSSSCCRVRHLNYGQRVSSGEQFCLRTNLVTIPCIVTYRIGFLMPFSSYFLLCYTHTDCFYWRTYTYSSFYFGCKYLMCVTSPNL